MFEEILSTIGAVSDSAKGVNKISKTIKREKPDDEAIDKLILSSSNSREF